MTFEPESSGWFFARCSGGWQPYAYQRRVADRLYEGANVELWAPTGAGKTLAVLVPFLQQAVDGGPRRWDRLIYALPLRSLVESIAAETRRVVERLAPAGIEVRIQTGERPDDVFFSEGDIIVTTYDQLLSGALEGPYGLPGKLHNINAAAVAGALVVFDEYHLMQTDLAFLTATAHLALYKSLCQSVWMTATATSPLRTELARALDVEQVTVADDELGQMPSVATVDRRIFMATEPLGATRVLERHRGRSIALVNTVDRADALFRALTEGDNATKERVILLHSRFLAEDRQRIEAQVRTIFARDGQERCILVCTQVIEAGMDLTCDVLHTEAAPMSALAQRAGRCARFPGETGEVQVYPLPESSRQPWRPYAEGDVVAALGALADHHGAALVPALVRELVEAAHRELDELRLRSGFRQRQEEVLFRARQVAIQRQPTTIGDLIRADDGQTIRVIIAREPGPANPYALEGFGLGRWALARLFEAPGGMVGWRWTPADETEWTPLQGPRDLAAAFAVCLHPDVASYSPTTGLRLGQSGSFESPLRRRPPRRGNRPLHRESWARHAGEVGKEAARLAGAAGLVLREGLAGDPWWLTEPQVVAAARTVGLVHDVGKLQVGWQTWAERAQRSLDPGYVHAHPLAHTDFNPGDPADRERERALLRVVPRPPHAAASAYYAAEAIAGILGQGGEPVSAELRAACLAAVLGHHGGWLSRSLPDTLGLQPLVEGASEALAAAMPERGGTVTLAPPAGTRPPRVRLNRLLEPAVGDGAWPEWWPVVAWLTRALRLADQRATSAYGGEE